MATKFTYKNEVGRKWDVGSGTRPTQTKLKKKNLLDLMLLIPVTNNAQFFVSFHLSVSLTPASICIARFPNCREGIIRRSH
jgi:hypothetical protein